ncbi:hypothetical protein AAMO2058_000837800 [Amorphochlora amoebiformis]
MSAPVAFKVIISNVKCKGLTTSSALNDPDATIDAFITFNWPGKGKPFKTQIIYDNPNPAYDEWAAEFFYSTQYPEHLKRRKLLVTATDYNRWKPNEAIGNVDLILALIASGPIGHHLTLTTAAGDACGEVYFEVEMQEVMRKLKIDFLDISLPGWVPNTTPGAQVCVQMTMTARPGEVIQTKLLPASVEDPEWKKSRPMKINIEVNDLLDYKFIWRVNFVLQGKFVPFLVAEGSFLDFASPDAKTRRVQVPLYMTTGTMQKCGSLDMYAKVTNGPRFHQILDKKALHTDKGVLYTGALHTFFPPPPGGVIKEDAKMSSWGKRGADEEKKAKLYDASKISNQDLKSVEEDKWAFEPRARRQRPEDDMIPLPRFWSLRYEGSGKYVRFMYRPTKQSTYQDPRGLPPGWSQCLSSSGELYWYQKETGGTTKCDPRGMPKNWKMVLERTGRGGYRKKFMYQHILSTHIDPRGIPQSFSQHLTPRGKIYFMDHTTHSTTFTDPRTLMSPEMVAAMICNDVMMYMDSFWAEAQALIKIEEEKLKKQRDLEAQAKKREQEKEDKIRSIDNKFLSWVETESSKWISEADKFDSEQRAKERTMVSELVSLEEKLDADLVQWEKEYLRKMQELKEKKLLEKEKKLETAKIEKEKKMATMTKNKQSWVSKFMSSNVAQIESKANTAEAEKKAIEDAFEKKESLEPTPPKIHEAGFVVYGEVISPVAIAQVSPIGIVSPTVDAVVISHDDVKTQSP